MKTEEVHDVARVTAVHKGSYYLAKGAKEVFAECSGRLLFASDSPMELPTTGDR